MGLELVSSTSRPAAASSTQRSNAGNKRSYAIISRFFTAFVVVAMASVQHSVAWSFATAATSSSKLVANTPRKDGAHHKTS